MNTGSGHTHFTYRVVKFFQLYPPLWSWIGTSLTIFTPGRTYWNRIPGRTYLSIWLFLSRESRQIKQKISRSSPGEKLANSSAIIKVGIWPHHQTRRPILLVHTVHRRADGQKFKFHSLLQYIFRKTEIAQKENGVLNNICVGLPLFLILKYEAIKLN